MKTFKAYLIKAPLALAAGTLIVTLAGCDYDYQLNYGRPYIGPVRSSYYYEPYVDLDYVSYGYPYSRPTLTSYYYTPYRSFGYGSYGYRSPYRRYGRGFGGRGFRGRRCR